MNQLAMLNAYPDSLGGTLSGAVGLLSRPEMKDVFGSFYILPSLFHTDLDRGFSVISYDLNRMLASEADLQTLRDLHMDLKLDFILNHLSVLSPQFQDILQRGDDSPYRDFFINWNSFWEGKGEMTEGGYIQPDPELIRDMFFRKPGLPILSVRYPDGREVPYWNTFYQEVRYSPLETQELMRALSLQYMEAQCLEALIRNAIETGRYAPDAGIRAEVRTRFGVGAETPVYASVGRLAPQKNPLFIVEIMNQILNREPEAQCWMIGDGELKDEVQARVRACHREGQIILLGERTDVGSLMQGMDAMVFPSLYEGLSIVMVEAQTAGLPILASDRLSEEHSLTPLIHYLSPERSAGEWAEEMIRLRKGTDRRNMTAAIAEKGYDIATEAEGLRKDLAARIPGTE